MSLLQNILQSAGGEIWQKPQTLQLRGEAKFTPFGKLEGALTLDTYNMWRVFPSENNAARTANGKVRFDAFAGENVFFQLKFDGFTSNMNLGEAAKPYAVHFKWSNNFGFGILRFADREGFTLEELVADQIEGHFCRFIKVTDPKGFETFFGIDATDYKIRMVGFSTEVGWHHRIYSDFERAKNGFLQPKRVRIYFEGIKWMDVHWREFVVNEQIADSIFKSDYQMNKIKKYENAILSILQEYAKIKYVNINGENRLIADRENHRYLVLTIGWDGKKFIHDCPMHFDIINGKIWIQKNMTEWDVGEMLEKQGVSKSEMVLGFLSPHMRTYSDYAVN